MGYTRRSMKVCGVGVNDADYQTHISKYATENGKRKKVWHWVCPFYAVWHNMLKRCYSEKYKDRWQTYKNKTVCSEWLYFMNFKRWMEEQDWEGKQLDKDLLYPGNVIYSPEACIFISGTVNTFIVTQENRRGDFPIGVSFHKPTRKFSAYCGNPFTKKVENLGSYLTPEEAHAAWKRRKLELAVKLAEIQDNPRVAKALIERYKIDD